MCVTLSGPVQANVYGAVPPGPVPSLFIADPVNVAAIVPPAQIA